MAEGGLVVLGVVYGGEVEVEEAVLRVEDFEITGDGL